MITIHKWAVFIVILFFIVSATVIYSANNKHNPFSPKTEINSRFSKYFENNFSNFFVHYFNKVDSITVYEYYVEICTENNTCSEYSSDATRFNRNEKRTFIKKTNKNWVAEIPVEQKNKITYEEFENEMTNKLCEIINTKIYKLYKNFTWKKESNIGFQDWVESVEKFNNNFPNAYSTCSNYENISAFYIDS